MKRFALIATLAGAAALAACSNDVQAPETIRLSVLLTDAPGDVLEAVVTISGIYLQEDATDDEPGGRVYLMDEPVTTNLLTLVDDFQTLVQGKVVGAGSYGQLRFIVDGAYITVETSTGQETYATPGYAEAPAQVDGQLHCPSCSQSGIKVNFTGGMTVGETDETIVVDFDVAETFGHQAGNSGMWVMNPSLKAATIDEASSL